MPVTTRSSTRPATATATATAAPTHTYHLRNERPSAGFYTEAAVDADVVAAAETLVSMRSASVSAPATRRSARIAQRS